MTQSNDERILMKLDQLLQIFTISATKDLKQPDQIDLLNRIGFPPKEIAKLLGTTSNTVSVTLSGLRKKQARSGHRSSGTAS